MKLQSWSIGEELLNYNIAQHAILHKTKLSIMTFLLSSEAIQVLMCEVRKYSYILACFPSLLTNVKKLA